MAIPINPPAGAGPLVPLWLRQPSAVLKMFLMLFPSRNISLAIFAWPGPGRAALEGWCPQLGKSTLIPGTAGPRGSADAAGTLSLLSTVEAAPGRGAPGPWSSSGDRKPHLVHLALPVA